MAGWVASVTFLGQVGTAPRSPGSLGLLAWALVQVGFPLHGKGFGPDLAGHRALPVWQGSPVQLPGMALPVVPGRLEDGGGWGATWQGRRRPRAPGFCCPRPALRQ